MNDEIMVAQIGEIEPPNFNSNNEACCALYKNFIEAEEYRDRYLNAQSRTNYFGLFRDLCFLKIQMPRGSGHSTSIVRMVYEYPNRDFLIVSPNRNMKMHLRDLFCSQYRFTNDNQHYTRHPLSENDFQKIMFITQDEFKNSHTLTGQSLELIIFDGQGQLSDQDIYNRLFSTDLFPCFRGKQPLAAVIGY